MLSTKKPNKKKAEIASLAFSDIWNFRFDIIPKISTEIRNTCGHRHLLFDIFFFFIQSFLHHLSFPKILGLASALFFRQFHVFHFISQN
ncbi:hypothetical protein CAEBREN_21707 [Caenorhabditis brenneri]|uniref:Uncharacterized protein n=1 Tax=Caenorhabditis brenneri TaxID=135651 RepID=G0MVK9_CAEBE|nr:hypothetical protein CAEBREN_21707 [Caenorhabditis brenneri]